MERSIASAFIFSLFIVTVVMSVRLNIVNNSTQAAALDEVLQLQESKLETQMTLATTTDPVVFRCDTKFNFMLRNVGTEPIDDLSAMDVILWYTSDATGEKVGTRLTYTEGNLAKDSWTFSITTSSTVDPAFWAPGDVASIATRPSQLRATSTQGYLNVISPGGVSASGYVDFTNLVSENCFYLHNTSTPPDADTVSHAVLPVDTELPTATTLFNYDTDRTSAAGLELVKTNQGLNESNATRFQVWRSGPLAATTTISGDVLFDVWAASKSFRQSRIGIMTFHLRDYDPIAVSHTEIGKGSVFARDWQFGSKTYLERMGLAPGFSYSIPAGNELEVFVVVETEATQDMWLAYDTEEYASLVDISFVAPTPSRSFYLHNFPTPPTADTVSHGTGVELTAANGRGRGITTNASSIWVVDFQDDLAYEYDMSVDPTGSWTTSAGGNPNGGITTDGSSIWVVNEQNDTVNVYDMFGTSTGSWGLTGANGDASGIATDGSSIWVVDDADDLVYVYDMFGTSTGSWDISATGNDNARGITTDGSSIWIVDDTDDAVYQYDTFGTSTGSFGLLAANSGATGITTDGISFWILDDTDDVVYRYQLDGTPVRVALPLDETAPTATTLFNYDLDRDNDPGLELKSTTLGLQETDPEKYNPWRTDPLTTTLAINGDIFIDLWGATRNFQDAKPGAFTVYLIDVDPNAPGADDPSTFYQEIGNGSVTSANWQSGSTSFVQHTITIPNITSTISQGHVLEIFVVVDNASARDMWFAYDTTAYQSALIIQVTSSATTTLYLHNDPTPPTADTESQEVLPMSQTSPTSATLFNYDTDRDTDTGLTVDQTAQDLSETNPDRYQVWRSAPLSSDMVIDGDVVLDFWSSVVNPQGGDPPFSQTVTVYLRDYTPAIASGSVFLDDWQSGSNTFVKGTIVIPNVSYSVAVGHVLEARLVAEDIRQINEMWIAYDTTAFPSVIKFP